MTPEQISPADWGFALAVLLIILSMLIFDKGLVTMARFTDMKERYIEEREARIALEKELRETVRQIERLADLIEVGKDVVRHASGD